MVFLGTCLPLFMQKQSPRITRYPFDSASEISIKIWILYKMYFKKISLKVHFCWKMRPRERRKRMEKVKARDEKVLLLLREYLYNALVWLWPYTLSRSGHRCVYAMHIENECIIPLSIHSLVYINMYREWMHLFSSMQIFIFLIFIFHFII